jgi:hypothetical protein
MTSIGFDDEPRREAVPVTEVTSLLSAIARELGARGKNSRQLLCIEFSVQTGHVEVTMRSDLLSTGYPSLATIMGEVARTCALDRIATTQFRRLLFSEDEVRLELVDAWGQPETYLYPVLPTTPLDA